MESKIAMDPYPHQHQKERKSRKTGHTEHHLHPDSMPILYPVSPGARINLGISRWRKQGTMEELISHSLTRTLNITAFEMKINHDHRLLTFYIILASFGL
ncbi:hypothetical protein TNCV_864461 [Trichonephila clavipes]|nr:hypothetical protein TNCV_864461 [Trichonephila clavipes]